MRSAFRSTVQLPVLSGEVVTPMAIKNGEEVVMVGGETIDVYAGVFHVISPT